MTILGVAIALAAAALVCQGAEFLVAPEVIHLLQGLTIGCVVAGVVEYLVDTILGVKS